MATAAVSRNSAIARWISASAKAIRRFAGTSTVRQRSSTGPPPRRKLDQRQPRAAQRGIDAHTCPGNGTLTAADGATLAAGTALPASFAAHICLTFMRPIAGYARVLATGNPDRANHR